MRTWLRLTLALLTARLVAWACRLLHYPGSSLPGVIALRLCPDAVALMAPAYERVLAVTGTNGKTTTANLLAHFLRAAGFSVAHNALGANMLPGVATAMFRDRLLGGRPRSRIALLEVDEGSVGKVFAAAEPELVIVTNYFRDQLDRYWELERTTALLRDSLARLPEATLILNADDPLVAAAGQARSRVRYFGVLKETGAGETAAAEVGEGTAEARRKMEDDHESAAEGREQMEDDRERTAEARGQAKDDRECAAEARGQTEDDRGCAVAEARGQMDDDRKRPAAGRQAAARHRDGGDGQAAPAAELAACETREGRFCLRCGTALTYRYIHFGQLGDYFCGNCGFRRPALDYAVRSLSEGESLSLTISMRGEWPPGGRPETAACAPGTQPLRISSSVRGSLRVKDGWPPGPGAGYPVGAAADPGSRDLQLCTPLRGFYNVYNILAATAAAKELGISDQVIQSAVRTYRPATGRMQDFLFSGRLCTLALIKNPVGTSEVLKTLIQTAGNKALVIAINDLAADGRDVSWLWDADFACLADPGVSRIICAGLRAADLAVCLKYAGVPLERIELAPERPASLRRLAFLQAERLYVLATYTNLFAYARLLGRMGKVVERHAPQGMSSLS
jgi:UDP-N-acetylmuramyl tripeptide synthase